MDAQFIRNRILSLVLKMNLSESKTSTDLGRSNSYIRNITSGKSLPSMTEFLNICNYFEITPKEFFDEDLQDPQAVHKLYKIAKQLPAEDLNILLLLAEHLDSSNH